MIKSWEIREEELQDENFNLRNCLRACLALIDELADSEPLCPGSHPKEFVFRYARITGRAKKALMPK